MANKKIIKKIFSKLFSNKKLFSSLVFNNVVYVLKYLNEGMIIKSIFNYRIIYIHMFVNTIQIN